MIGLERHIEILLLDNDCVIVPELGGFVAHRVEARFDDRDQLFLPPMRTLGFNPKLKMNDSLLVQSYIEAYDISYPDAMNRIEDEVNELMQSVQNEGSYELNDIGTLYLNEDGNLAFTPCEAGLLTPELYGLDGVEMERLAEAAIAEPESEPQAVQEAPVAAVKRLIPEEKAAAAEPETAPLDEEEAAAEPRTIKIRVSTLRNAVAIAAMIIVCFFIATPLGDQSRCSFEAGSMEKSILKDIMPKAVVTATHQQPAAETAAPKGQENVTAGAETQKTETEKPAAETEKQAEPAAEPQAAHYYTLVLASCVADKNARAYVAELQKQGFDSAQVIQRKNGAKVIYGQYAAEADAYAALRRLHGVEYFREAWVYEIKKTSR